MQYYLINNYYSLNIKVDIYKKYRIHYYVKLNKFKYIIYGTLGALHLYIQATNTVCI